MTISEAELKRRFDTLTSHGWLTWNEAKLLQECLDCTSGPIVEVGTYFGRSAMLMAYTGRYLICIDPWDDSFSNDYPGDWILRQFRENMNRVPNARLEVIRNKVEYVKPFTAASLVYLDGDHTYSGTIAQVKFALGCDPDIIAVHDVNNDGQGVKVKRAAVGLLGAFDKRADRLAVWLRNK